MCPSGGGEDQETRHQRRHCRTRGCQSGAQNNRDQQPKCGCSATREDCQPLSHIGWRES
ncbi:hypothetical protein B566_EDAN008454 [Ephemera danica]|nr:hypothetical protein B566_EDAN008454 [Ephemera danica]